jgi:hypothetical protein
MEDGREDILESAKHLTRSDSGTTGSARGATSRDGANSVTPVQQAEVPEPRAGAWCSSIRSGHRSIGSPFASPPWRVRTGTDTSWLPWTLLRVAWNICLPKPDSSTVADALVSNFCRFEVPIDLHSDEGRNFESRLMQEESERLGISKSQTTPLHPQSDGMVERYMETSTCGRSFRYTREIGTRGYLSSCWPAEHQPTRQQARRLPAWCSSLPCDLLLGLRQQGAVCDRLLGGPYRWPAAIKDCSSMER